MIYAAIYAATGVAFYAVLFWPTARKERRRPMPRLDHDCDVYSGAYGQTAERVRMECLEAADRELSAAVVRFAGRAS
jgi:hypothetical protein